MNIKKWLFALLLIGAVSISTPASASSYWMPMWKARVEARKDVRQFEYKYDYEDARLGECWRNSGTVVTCWFYVDTYDGITCYSKIRERKDTYGVWASFPGRSKCSYA